MHRAGGARGDLSEVLRCEDQHRLALQRAPTSQTPATLPKSFPCNSTWKCSAFPRPHGWEKQPHHPPNTASFQRQQNQSPFPLCAHLQWETLSSDPKQIPPVPSRQAGTRAGHQGWSTNATDFISAHLSACCWRLAVNRVQL